MDDTRRGFFGKLAQLAGGLAFTGVWAKGCLQPAPAHAEPEWESHILSGSVGLDAVEAQAIADGTGFPLTTLDGRVFTPAGEAAAWRDAVIRVERSIAAHGALLPSGGSIRELVDNGQEFSVAEYQDIYNQARAKEQELLALVPKAPAHATALIADEAQGLADATVIPLIAQMYREKYTAEEYRDVYDALLALETYRRVLAEGDMDRALAVVKATGAVTGADGGIDFIKLHALEVAYFGKGWMHPSHPTAMRLKQQYYKHFNEKVEGFSWPEPGFVGGPDAQSIVSTERTGESLFIAPDRRALRTLRVKF